MYRRALAVIAALFIVALILDFNQVGEPVTPNQQTASQQTQS